EGEKATEENHKNPYIIRLGWQIGYEKTNNQMLQFLYEKMRVDGVIKASCLWYPSTSFIKDTAQAIHQIVSCLDPGIYHVNSNDQYSYFDIVTYLTTLYPDLKVLKTKDFKADHRMIDDRVSIRKFSEVLPQSQ
ncbi:MAG: hypothetical protein WCZ19_00605, partial [Acholeplasma sp.]